MMSPIKSTCCWHEKIIWLFTPGLCGPVIINMFGKPATIAQIGLRAIFPFLIDGEPVLALNVDLFHCAGHGIKASGEHDGVDLVGLAVARLDAPFRDLFNWVLSD